MRKTVEIIDPYTFDRALQELDAAKKALAFNANENNRMHAIRRIERAIHLLKEKT